jgi:hypothetical protein
MANTCSSRRIVVGRMWQRVWYGVLRHKSDSYGDANRNNSNRDSDSNRNSNPHGNGDTSAKGI